jgi:myo-inositol-1(or 4)-monophosphatase
MRFSGAEGQGAWRGRERLTVSARPPERAIVATAFPFRARQRMERYMPVLRGVFERTEDLRRAGSAALELSWTAAGVWDGYFELSLGVWDVAAGALLVREAGGVVTDWDGGDRFLDGDVLAGSPQAHGVLLEEAARRR